MNRRTFVYALCAVLLACSASLAAKYWEKQGAAKSIANDKEENVVEAMRTMWFSLLAGDADDHKSDSSLTPVLTALSSNAKKNWASMDKSAGRNRLWSDLPDRSDSRNITAAYGRLKPMAAAFATKGSELYGNKELLSDVVSALDWLNVNWYNEQVRLPIGKQLVDNNWWDYEIGVPLLLNDITVLLYDKLSPEQTAGYMRAIDHYTPDCATMVTTTGSGAGGKTTGANLVWKCTIQAVRGVIGNDHAKIADAQAKLGPVFQYVTDGDGFYRDGSFIQHGKHPYTGGYGISLLSNMTKVIYLLSGTEWSIPERQLSLVYSWVHNSFEPLLYRGSLPAMVRGREISRTGGDHSAGHSLINTAVLISRFAPEPEAGRIKSMVKELILKDTGSPYFKGSMDMFTFQSARKIVEDPSVTPRGDLTLHRTFAGMDRVVHQRPGFAFGLSLFSSRVYNYESINNENLHGWYTGYGMTYLLTRHDLMQYDDGFWPTVDSYRLPGTTVETGRRENGFKQSQASSADWVGGVTLDNRYGAAGLDLRDVTGSLTAKKSWFMFDQEMVSLGAGITDMVDSPVETVVDNRKINGGGKLTVDGKVMPDSPGWSQILKGAHWMHTDGPNIGYYFPGGAEVSALRESRTGAYKDINLGQSPAPVKRDYLTLYLNHGAHPQNLTYAYVLLPDMTAEQVRQYANRPEVNIAANDTGVQAVEHTGLRMVGANFWGSSDTKLVAAHGISDYLSCSGTASVMVRETDNSIVISASDPTQKAAAPVLLQLQVPTSGVVAKPDDRIRIVSTHPQTVIEFNFKDAAGASLSLELAKSSH